jgi:hypothetical protein
VLHCGRVFIIAAEFPYEIADFPRLRWLSFIVEAEFGSVRVELLRRQVYLSAGPVPFLWDEFSFQWDEF